MSRIQELIADKNDQLDFDSLLENFPWIVEKNKKCILSPDSDGLLCGLLMTYLFDWEVVGFYDGKVMVLKDGISCYDENTVFLDMEIYRKGVKSMGHHMMLLNYNKKPTDWDEKLNNCIQPNNFRDYDGSHLFRLKYPLATIHMLLAIAGHKENLELPESAMCPLLFTDGTFQVLFSYPENVLNWLNFFKIHEDPNNPLQQVFLNKNYTVYGIMQAMDEFFRERDKISIPKERGDRLRISDTSGRDVNIEKDNKGNYFINNEAKARIEKFISLLAETTGWEYIASKWTYSDMRKFHFRKADFQSNNWNVNLDNYKKMIDQRPLSWAMTSGQNIEYTLESPDQLP